MWMWCMLYVCRMGNVVSDDGWICVSDSFFSFSWIVNAPPPKKRGDERKNRIRELWCLSRFCLGCFILSHAAAFSFVRNEILRTVQMHTKWIAENEVPVQLWSLYLVCSLAATQRAFGLWGLERKFTGCHCNVLFLVDHFWKSLSNCLFLLEIFCKTFVLYAFFLLLMLAFQGPIFKHIVGILKLRWL